MIDLSGAPKQKERANGPIPPKSVVWMKMEIRKPKTGKKDPNDPTVTIYSTGLKGLDCEFTVVKGEYEGLQMWEKMFLPPEMQHIDLNKGQERICKACFAKLRGIVDSVRGLDPEDSSKDNQRSIDSWWNLNGLEFPVKVGISKPKKDDRFINNSFTLAVCMGHKEYDQVKDGGEIITKEKIPEIPESDKGSGGGNPEPSWADDGAKSSTSPQDTTPPPTDQEKPPWA